MDDMPPGICDMQLHDAQHFQHRAHKEHAQNQQDDRAGDGRALLGEAAGSQIIACDREYACAQAQQHQHLAIDQIDNQRGDVAGEIDYLGDAVCALEIHVRKAREQQDKERAGARAIEAVVQAQCEGDGAGEHNRMPKGELLTVFAGKEIPLAQHIQRGQRQDDEHQHAEQALADEQRDVRAQRCAGQRRRRAENAQLPVDIAGERILGGGDRCAHGGGELIGGDTGMHRQTTDQIGGKGDQAAAAGDGIDKAGDAHQRADDKKMKKCELHREAPFAIYRKMARIIV